MVRSPLAGAASNTTVPDYFDSLESLASCAAAPSSQRSRFAAPLVPLVPRADHRDHRTKLAVCHDYKGGYSERDDERGYTFGWWHLIDTFIYFSHHRVTCPPAGWIRTAHQSGTKILGTLIFEHDAGQADVVELVGESSATPSARFERLSTRYADDLVDLALERGFDGWLVNVEVELGGPGAGEQQKKAHAHALVTWLRYFAGEIKRRVPGGEVMWYDAVTIDGHLSWQNAVTERNLPFFAACHSIFLNYWWRHDHVTSTAKLLKKLGSVRHSDVYFGIDVFGRGTLAGGGFESWRAAHAIKTALPASSAASSFSIALFAPGWTVECESLQHSLTSPTSFQRWQADDDYLFASATPTPSVAPEVARHERERREQRGVLRARHLAAQTAPSASPVPLAYRMPSPPTFDYNAPLASLPGTELGIAHKPLAAFLPAPHPTPAPDLRFYTTFSGGSGHAFFVEGLKMFEHGWTDPAFAGPPAALVFHPPGIPGVEAQLIESDAWEGPRALQLQVDSTGQDDEGDKLITVPLCALALPELSPREELVVDVVWKASAKTTTSRSQPRVVPQLGSRADSPELVATNRSDEDLPRGWRRSRVCYRVPAEGSKARTWHLSVGIPSAHSYLLGALSVYPAPAPSSPHLVPSAPRYDISTSSLQWTIDLRTAPFDTTMSLPIIRDSVSRPQHYHLFHRISGVDNYLGTTSAQEFPLNLALLHGHGEVVVTLVHVDGRKSEAAAEVKSLMC